MPGRRPDRIPRGRGKGTQGTDPANDPSAVSEGSLLAMRSQLIRGRSRQSHPGTNGVVPLDEEKFQSLLEQVRELHRLADEATRERARFDAYVQARLRWDDRAAPALPAAQRDLADQAVDALSRPRLSTSQSRQVYRAFFGKSPR